jgi:hypothetical protein
LMNELTTNNKRSKWININKKILRSIIEKKRPIRHSLHSIQCSLLK